MSNNRFKRPGELRPYYQPRDNFTALRQGRGEPRAPVETIKPTPIELPDNLFIPPGAESIDLKNLFDVTAGARATIIDFTNPATGGLVVILSYAVFNDGLLASDFDFFPTVNNKRVYQYHGDPLDNFRIYLGTGPDLSNGSLINAQLYLQPGHRLRWVAENRAAVDTSMGVRVVGYVDRTKQRTQRRFGG